MCAYPSPRRSLSLVRITRSVRSLRDLSITVPLLVRHAEQYLSMDFNFNERFNHVRHAIKIGDWLLPALVALFACLFWYSPPMLEVMAGVALFLLGMRLLEEGLERLSGGLLEKHLQGCTSSMGKAICFGTLTTGIMQSSSLVSILSISFISSGLITLYAGLGIIYGANLGTTSGAWLMAAYGLNIKLSTLALPLLIFGMLATLTPARRWQPIGRMVMGIGLLFLGIHFMKTGFTEFRGDFGFADLSQQGRLAILIFAGLGILATVIMQSSHASLVLILTALDQQHIAYENALALAIGANVGTSITTAILGGLGSNAKGQQLAIGHLIFNLSTAVIAFILFPLLLWTVDVLADLLTIKSDHYAMKLAIFHSVFNGLGILLMVPISHRLQKFLQAARQDSVSPTKQPKYLQTSSLGAYTSALAVTRKEAKRLHKHIQAVLCRGIDIQPLSKKTKKIIHKQAVPDTHDFIIHHEQQVIKPLTGAILEFITQVQNKYPNKSITPFRNIRSACHYWGQSIKSVQLLQPYFSLKFRQQLLRDNNKELGDAYADIQHTLQKTLISTRQAIRELTPFLTQDKPSSDQQVQEDVEDHVQTLIMILKTEQEHHFQWKKTSERRIEDLLSQQKVNPEQATLLMEHYGYARYINRCLVLAAHHWMMAHLDINEYESSHLIQLDQEISNAYAQQFHTH